MNTTKKLSVVVLISGKGSNLQAILDAINSSALQVEVKAVISTNQNAYGLQRAKAHNIPTHILLPADFKTPTTYDEALGDRIAHYSPDLIVLAGFMKILGDGFLQRFKNSIVNIHPSLLPQYPGRNTHEQAIKEGVHEHGCSIHFVNEDIDAGPVIAEAAVKVKHDDTVAILKDRVHIAEHFLYPTVLNWFTHQRIQLIDDKVLLDKIPIPKNGLRFTLNGL